MKTYQDFLESRDLLSFINWHKSTGLYKEALDADEYDKKRNVEILRYQKFIFDVAGCKHKDVISPNNKLCSGFFPQFITQQNQYLLGNGVQFEKPETKTRLGKRFDTELQKLGRCALLHGKAFGYWADRLHVFPVTEFVPLYDETDGTLKAGIRFWQVDSDKPLNITLYEADGYTQYISKNNGKPEITAEKQPYIVRMEQSEAFGAQVVGTENYSTLPIKQLNGNPNQQSELVGIRGQIDAYDRIKSGFANDMDMANFVYWLLKNSGGMTDKELTSFVQRVKNIGVVVAEDESAVPEMKTQDIPYQARQVYLEKLEKDLYRDFGALDVTVLQGGQKTATEIQAAYLPVDLKADMYEYELVEFVQSILELLKIEDTPKFKRNRVVNETELVQTVLMKADRLDEETVLTELGYEPEQVQEIIRKKEDEANARYSAPDVEQTEETLTERKTDEAAL